MFTHTVRLTLDRSSAMRNTRVRSLRALATRQTIRKVRRDYIKLRAQRAGVAPRNEKPLTTKQKLKRKHPTLTFAEAWRSYGMELRKADRIVM